MIIIVDDEPIALEGTKAAVLAVRPTSEIKTFSLPRQAIEFVKDNNVDCAFLDISMPFISGIDVAKEIKSIRPLCNIVFTTGYDNYYADAFNVNASDYLLKPITEAKVEHALQSLRHPLEETVAGVLFIKCFGNFEIFYNGIPVKFKRLKSKELIAYVVSRDGAAVSKNEIMANIFETDNTSYYGVLKKDICDSLHDLGIEDILLKTWKTVAIDKTKVQCDFFDYIDGKPSGINAYNGEFMTQYSWAEYMQNSLVDKYNNKGTPDD